jgi:hypothetical protein
VENGRKRLFAMAETGMAGDLVLLALGGFGLLVGIIL